MSNAPSPTRDDPTPPVKRRRGRQPRPSLLSELVKAAVARFALSVGQPKVIEPAGFRDFRGWLAHIANPSSSRYWAPLVQAVIQDCDGDVRVIHKIKPDLVREIVRAVVIPREGESSKLVSTNCGRQCARPSSGVTLMTILDRIFTNLRQWREFWSSRPISPASEYHHPLVKKYSSAPSSHYGLSSLPTKVLTRGSARTSNNSSFHRQPELLSIDEAPPEQRSRSTSSVLHGFGASMSEAWEGADQNIHSNKKRRAQASLPSFRELEDSLLPPVNLGKRGRT